MKNRILNQLIAVLGLAAGFAAVPAHSQTVLLIGGGNASQTVLYDRVSNILSSVAVTISPTNSTVRTYTGTLAGVGSVTIHFSLVGAIQGLQDLENQNSEITATGASLIPTLAVSTATPGAVGVDPTPFAPPTTTLVVPYAFIKNPSAGGLAALTNLTQRQASFLEGAAGTNATGALPISFFGGANSSTLYFVGRNTASAVRTETDANIYFNGTLSTWTTNGAGQPIPDPAGGQNSGANVRALLAAIPNAIGTVAAQDISTYTTLSYEGVPYSITNVENGSYPLWAYENWYSLSAGSQGAPSANQQLVINALSSAVTNSAFQATNTLVFVNKFAPLSGLQVTRYTDGGPIFPLNY